MRSFRSLTAGGKDRASEVAKEVLPDFAERFPGKLYWFLTKGYRPHEWQSAFHSAHNEHGRLARFRHLVAGRRGGKTMSAAWEVLFYALHPEEFHRDAHSVDSNKPLWIWVLTKDHEVGRPARMALQEAMNTCGLVKDVDYRWNKNEKTVEFLESDTFLQFRSADDPQSLRGAGLDILWIDESAFIQTNEAWVVARPALSDKVGLVITTTTPLGKNWFWEEFFTGKALQDPRQFRVEYTSIDSPYFHKEEWDYALEHMHPAAFKQEHMASFDAMAGIALNGEWLHYYTMGDPRPTDPLGSIAIAKGKDGRMKLRRYLGVDVSTGESDDEFAICALGLSEDLTQGYILDYWKGKIPFPDQVDKIKEYQLRHRPELIGIESNGYQRSLAQQANRLEGFPGIVPVMAKGKKVDRIMAMSPLFKIGKIRIHQSHTELIDQWVSYNPSQKANPRDDLLDAMEIAIGVAGVLLPVMQQAPDKQIMTLEEEAAAAIKAIGKAKAHDEEMGSEW